MEVSTRSNHKNRNFLENCKQLIVELSQSLAQQTEENDKLRVRVGQLELMASEGSSQDGVLKSRINQLERKRAQDSSLSQEREQGLERQRKSLELSLHEKTKELQIMTDKTNKLHSQLSDKQTQISQLQKSLKTTCSHITFLKNEMETMRKKFHDQERQYEQEIQHLREFNEDIKKKFSLIQQEYTSILKDNSQPFRYQSPLLNQPKRSYDKPTFDLSVEARSKRRSSRPKRGQLVTVNPQMGQELAKIKEEISSQYDKLNHTKESLMKTRVTSTLTNIETILTEMSSRLQQDSSQYE